MSSFLISSLNKPPPPLHEDVEQAQLGNFMLPVLSGLDILDGDILVK